jgi:hypothetical protein
MGVVTCENSMGIVQLSRGSLEPASPHLLSEVEIIASLGKAAPRAAARRPASPSRSKSLRMAAESQRAQDVDQTMAIHRR